MQEEVNQKTVALYIQLAKSGAKLTGKILQAAIREYLGRTSGNSRASPGQRAPVQGKQSMGRLMKQNSSLKNIEITEGNIRSFERTARKYHIAYALKKDTVRDPPRYLVFFRAADVDVMEAAFKEYAGKSLHTERKPSIRKQLARAQSRTLENNREKQQTKQKHRQKKREVVR